MRGGSGETRLRGAARALLADESKGFVCGGSRPILGRPPSCGPATRDLPRRRATFLGRASSPDWAFAAVGNIAAGAREACGSWLAAFGTFSLDVTWVAANNPHGESTGGCALLRLHPLSPQPLRVLMPDQGQEAFAFGAEPRRVRDPRICTPCAAPERYPRLDASRSVAAERSPASARPSRGAPWQSPQSVSLPSESA